MDNQYECRVTLYPSGPGVHPGVKCGSCTLNSSAIKSLSSNECYFSMTLVIVVLLAANIELGLMEECRDVSP